MIDKERTPPPDGRVSSSSDNISDSHSSGSSYKATITIESKCDNGLRTRSKAALNFSPEYAFKRDAYNNISNNSKYKLLQSQKPKPNFDKPPKLKIDDDSDFDMDQSESLASPLQKKPPAIKKGHRTRSRVLQPPETPDRLQGSASQTKEVMKENCRPVCPPRLSSPLATPPHKRLRALQINADNISRGVLSPLRPCSSPLRLRKFSPRGSLFNSGRKSQRNSPLRCHSVKRPSINPYTPERTFKTVHLLKNKAHYSSDSGYSDDSWLADVGKSTPSVDMETEEGNQLDLQDMSTNRYKEEFCEESLLGSGEYGKVFKCLNKLDGCTYAIKRSLEPIFGHSLLLSRNEVYAEAILGKHAHIVRYHSAWTEGGYLYIQNEFCNGGSLAEEIAIHQQRGTRFTELELKEILRQVSIGLKYVHGMMLAHMDMKPGNIFIQYNQMITQSPESGIEEDILTHEECEIVDELTYKIGDFGHVTRLLHPRYLEEGDCRYLPKEILSENHENLSKADIFALGLTIYQAATLAELPKNGDEWHDIRSEKLPYMTGYSVEFNDLIRRMVHPDPAFRPTALLISTHPALCPEHLRTREQLARALQEERTKNHILSEKLKEIEENNEKSFKESLARLPTLPPSLASLPRPNTRASRLVGLKVNRSKSLTNF